MFSKILFFILRGTLIFVPNFPEIPPYELKGCLKSSSRRCRAFCPSHLEPSWRTAGVFEATWRHRSSSPLPPCTATQTTVQTHTANSKKQKREIVAESLTELVETPLLCRSVAVTLRWVTSCALNSRWASTILSIMYLCSRVRLADRAWCRWEVTPRKSRVRIESHLSSLSVGFISQVHLAKSP